MFGVGDDDQTIYGYNGADPAWLIDFGDPVPRRRRPSARGQLPLPGRHRRGRSTGCCATTGAGSAKTIRAAAARAGRLVGRHVGRPGGGRPRPRSKRAWPPGRAPADVAVLTRVNASLAPVQLALVAAGVPVAGGVGLEFADRTSVRAVLAWLRLATGRRRVHARRPRRGAAPAVAAVAPEGRRVGRRAGRRRRVCDGSRRGSTPSATPSGWRASPTTSSGCSKLAERRGIDRRARRRPARRRSVWPAPCRRSTRTRHGMNRAAQGDDLAAIRHLAALHDDAATFERWLRARPRRAALGQTVSCSPRSIASRDRSGRT